MKASELINELQQLIEKYGDFPVDIWYNDKISELKEVCYGICGADTDTPLREYIALLNYKQ